MQPKPTDYIELWVEDDGDTILCKRQEPQSGGPAEPISFLTSNLCFGVNELEELKAELVSYGCWDEATIDRAIKETLDGAYNEVNNVR